MTFAQSLPIRKRFRRSSAWRSERSQDLVAFGAAQLGTNRCGFAAQYENAIGKKDRFVDVVRNEQGREPARFDDCAQLTLQLVAA